jgi:hypothetical protein
VPYASRIVLTSGVLADIATVTLPVGEWWISGEAWFVVDTGTPQIARVAAAISPNSATAPSDPADNISVTADEPQQTKQSGGATTGIVLPLSQLYVNVTAPTPYYLTLMISWSGVNTGISGYGKIAGLMRAN